MRSLFWPDSTRISVELAGRVPPAGFTCARLVMLMLTGVAALEDFAVNRATRELNALLQRATQIAHRHSADFAEVEDVPATEVRVGDHLLVRPAEIMPVDGALVSGRHVAAISPSTSRSVVIVHFMPRSPVRTDPGMLAANSDAAGVGKLRVAVFAPSWVGESVTTRQTVMVIARCAAVDIGRDLLGCRSAE